MISANQLHSEDRLIIAEARQFDAKRPDSRGFLLRSAPFCALRTHLSHQHNPRVSHVVERAHRDQAIGVLGQSPVAGLGVAPQSLDVQKRMLNVCAHRALAPVLGFLRIRQRRVSLRSLVGEVLRIRRGLFDRVFLSPIGAVAVDPRLRTVQEIGHELRVVHVCRRGRGTVDEPTLGIRAKVQLHAEIPDRKIQGRVALPTAASRERT